jgi:hypothetical protein
VLAVLALKLLELSGRPVVMVFHPKGGGPRSGGSDQGAQSPAKAFFIEPVGSAADALAEYLLYFFCSRWTSSSLPGTLSTYLEFGHL